MFPECTVRAFADDIALTLHDFWQHAGLLQKVFEEFGAVSGLHLNLPKTVVIPLWPANFPEVRSVIANNIPAWADVSVDVCGVYLGFATGPGKGNRSWDKPLSKFTSRVKLWDWSALGLFFAAVAYRVFVASVLLFVGQLENPPPDVCIAERQALRRAAPGPGNWATPADLWSLRESFGFPASFLNIGCSIKASQIRVATCEAESQGGLRATTRAAELDQLQSASTFTDRIALWGEWYAGSHVRVLRQAVLEFRSAGFSRTGIINDLAGSDVRPYSDKVRLRIKRGFQKQVGACLLKQMRVDPLERVRRKLARWELPGTPRIQSERVLRRLRKLNSLAPPRVAAAVFGTIWNRWTTARRFQQRASPLNRCVFGCSQTAEDSIEHYSRCSVVLDFGRRWLGLHCVDGSALPAWTLAVSASKTLDDDTLICGAVHAYAAYRATNAARHSGGTSPGRATELLTQFAKEAARGHKRATAAVDNRWSRRVRPRHDLADEVAGCAEVGEVFSNGHIITGERFAIHPAPPPPPHPLPPPLPPSRSSPPDGSIPFVFSHHLSVGSR